MRFIGLTFAVLSLTGCPETGYNSADEGAVKEQVLATAKIEPASGSSVDGSVRFVRAEGGLIVTGQFSGVKPAGAHGLHIHERGDCSAEDATSAGGHFNPAGDKHGAPNAQESHLGDLGNLEVSGKGDGQFQVFLKDSIYLTEQVESWDVIIGKAVVLHAGRDDFRSQPAGDAGKRIGCGVIVAAGGAAAAD